MARNWPYHSQNDEEKHILEHFKVMIPPGKFLDIGAFGVELSNTVCLSKLGWTGILYEPSEKPYNSLVEYYKDNSKIQIIKKAIDVTAGTKTWYDSNGDALSSLVKGNSEKYDVKSFETTVDCITPDEIFTKHGYDFDFISLDVEQNNLLIFKLLPFARLENLQMICVEHDRHMDEMKAIIKPFGFYEITRNGENIIFVKEK
jgi:FkbM family methyltransferase